jgi:hypothetical protein
MKNLFAKVNISQVILNLATILIVAAMLFVNRVIASPDNSPAAPNMSMDVLSYQGTLADSSGNPVTGDKDMTFRIYNHATDPTPLWEEAHTGTNAVPVQNGLFNIMLGSLNPIPDSVWDEAELYLGIQIGTEAEMTPREKIQTVPTAISAEAAQTALSVANGAVGSNGFAPTWYESHNNTTYENSTTAWMPTDNVITFTCEIDCTILIMHRALVMHDTEGGRVDVRINIDGSFALQELSHPYGYFGPVSGDGLFDLQAGTHTVEVLFAVNNRTPGTAKYYGDSGGSWDHLNIMVFAQK